MKFVAYTLAAIMILLGLLFLLAAGQGNAVVRIGIGVICWVAAAVLVGLIYWRPPAQTHVHKTQLDLSGDVKLESLTCQSCSGQLSEKSVRVEAGAVFVNCEFCGAAYQLEEAPKW